MIKYFYIYNSIKGLHIILSYNRIKEKEIDGIVSKRNKLQVMNFNQLKLDVQDTY